jgi:hypothetical protein
MKKLFAIAMAVAMMLTLFAACGEAAPKMEVPASAEEILNNVWSKYAEDQKFAVVGGDPMNGYMEGPAAWDMTNTESMPYTLLIPQENIANVDGVASMIHMMNANTFTCGVYHMAAGTDTAAFADTMKNVVLNNQWMCGFPEKLIVAVIDGEYVLTVFGVNDAIDPFETKLAEAHPEAVIAYNEAIAG